MLIHNIFKQCSKNGCQWALAQMTLSPSIIMGEVMDSRLTIGECVTYQQQKKSIGKGKK